MDDFTDTIEFALARNSLETSITHGLAFALRRAPEFQAKFVDMAWSKLKDISDGAKSVGTISIKSVTTEATLITKTAKRAGLVTDILIKTKCGKEIAVENKVTDILSVDQAERYADWSNNPSHCVIYLTPYTSGAKNIIPIRAKNTCLLSYSSVSSILRDQHLIFGGFHLIFSGIEEGVKNRDAQWEAWYEKEGKVDGRKKRSASERIDLLRYKIAGLQLEAEIEPALNGHEEWVVCRGFSNGSPTITVKMMGCSSKKDYLECGIQIQGKHFRRYLRHPDIRKEWKIGGKYTIPEHGLGGLIRKWLLDGELVWDLERSTYGSFDLNTTSQRSPFLYRQKDFISSGDKEKKQGIGATVTRLISDASQALESEDLGRRLLKRFE